MHGHYYESASAARRAKRTFPAARENLGVFKKVILFSSFGLGGKGGRRTTTNEMRNCGRATRQQQLLMRERERERGKKEGRKVEGGGGGME